MLWGWGHPLPRRQTPKQAGGRWGWPLACEAITDSSNPRALPSLLSGVGSVGGNPQGCGQGSSPYRVEGRGG